MASSYEISGSSLSGAENFTTSFSCKPICSKEYGSSRFRSSHSLYAPVSTSCRNLRAVAFGDADFESFSDYHEPIDGHHFFEPEFPAERDDFWGCF